MTNEDPPQGQGRLRPLPLGTGMPWGGSQMPSRVFSQGLSLCCLFFFFFKLYFQLSAE